MNKIWKIKNQDLKHVKKKKNILNLKKEVFVLSYLSPLTVSHQNTVTGESEQVLSETKWDMLRHDFLPLIQQQQQTSGQYLLSVLQLNLL